MAQLFYEVLWKAELTEVYGNPEGYDLATGARINEVDATSPGADEGWCDTTAKYALGSFCG